MVLPTAITALFRKLFVIFADDTNIFCSELDAVQLCIIIIVGNELDNLAVWFVVNKIIFIVDKTNFMAFGNSMQIYTTVQASIDNNNIKSTHNGKDGGAFHQMEFAQNNKKNRVTEKLVRVFLIASARAHSVPNKI